MEFKQLQSFVAVVQEGSFTQAAAKLFISQPTISLHISQLEAELNTRLILRTTKSIRITAKGHELYGYAINILELKKRMLQVCSIENQRIIHLGASTIPSAYILPQLLPQFGSLHSDIYFVIHQSDSQGIIDGLHSGLFNLGFIGMQANDDDLICQPFCQDRMIIITPVNEHFLALKTSGVSAISLLEQEPLILRENGSGSQKIADKFLAGSGLDASKLHIVARVNDQEAIKNLVAGGLGISIISALAAANFIQEKRLLAFTLPQRLSERSLYMVYRKSYLLPTYIQDFLKFIMNSAK